MSVVATPPTKDGSGRTARRWCFTLNNYTPEEEAAVAAFAAKPDCVYLCVGREVGESGTPHLQGYVVMRNAIRMTALKVMSRRLHCEIAVADTTMNRAYCSKDGNVAEFGVPPREGEVLQKYCGELEKERWASARRAAAESRFDDIPDDIYVKHFGNVHAISACASVPLPALDHLTRHLWYYGAPGTGKSLKARSEYPNAFIKDANQWWDGYSGQDVVIIEDLDHYNVGLTRSLKIWADIYDFPAERKGSTLGRIRPKLLIVTSNYSIDDIWSDKPVCCEALKRRFKQVSFSGAFPLTVPPPAVVPTFVQPPVHPAFPATPVDEFVQSDEELFDWLSALPPL